LPSVRAPDGRRNNLHLGQIPILSRGALDLRQRSGDHLDPLRPAIRSRKRCAMRDRTPARAERRSVPSTLDRAPSAGQTRVRRGNRCATPIAAGESGGGLVELVEDPPPRAAVELAAGAEPRGPPRRSIARRGMFARTPASR